MSNMPPIKLHSFRSLLLGLGYLFWAWAIALTALTLMTFVLARQNLKPADISEVYGSSEFFLAALSSTGFVFFLLSIYPISQTTLEAIISKEKLTRKWLPGLLRGGILGASVALTFIVFGLYSAIGFLVHIENTGFAIAGTIGRIAAILGMTYSEEYIFRGKLLPRLRTQFGALTAMIIVSLFYCLVKRLQFADLSVMQTLTLFLLSLRLGVRSVLRGNFSLGAGEYAGLLILFHIVMSLPVFGMDFQGIWLIKYHPTESLDSESARFISGGVGGPLSSFGLQVLLSFDVIQTMIRNKKLFL